MSKIMTNSSLSVKGRSLQVDRGDVVWFSLFVLAGGLAILHPFILLGCLAVAVVLGFCWLMVLSLQRAQLEVWQVLVLIAMTGYILLSYGFENLAFHIGGVPIIVSYGLMYAALFLAAFAHRHLLVKAIKEPAVFCMLGLLVLTLLHLVVDIPSYGIWAIRDSTMCLDGIFMILGLLWAIKPNSTVFMTKWLMVVFVLNHVLQLYSALGRKVLVLVSPERCFSQRTNYWKFQWPR